MISWSNIIRMEYVCTKFLTSLLTHSNRQTCSNTVLCSSDVIIIFIIPHYENEWIFSSSMKFVRGFVCAFYYGLIFSSILLVLLLFIYFDGMSWKRTQRKKNEIKYFHVQERMCARQRCTIFNFNFNLATGCCCWFFFRSVLFCFGCQENQSWGNTEILLSLLPIYHEAYMDREEKKNKRNIMADYRIFYLHCIKYTHTYIGRRYWANNGANNRWFDNFFWMNELVTLSLSFSLNQWSEWVLSHGDWMGFYFGWILQANAHAFAYIFFIRLQYWPNESGLPCWPSRWNNMRKNKETTLISHAVRIHLHRARARLCVCVVSLYVFMAFVWNFIHKH